ncbi:16S rRNA (uracil(1498)-N(3))-methyltransferase [Croceivirga radicis]|uniref:16S rRNA (uracil(1498)-N(3))-methyltransferase n=1 Tax=Croceivirga radicis TaxID=1929488 RepID=UPI000255AACB|nr:16S rRNA (uracil(1498)-N(3))-methyltransferase [Croceivirga radicis]
MQLFYNPLLNKNTTTFSFDKEESRHIAKVLRKKEGDALYITNGKGLLFKAELLQADFKKCVVKILETDEKETEPYHLHIAVAPTKMNDRFEWFLEKATEIGISEITPLLCDHSERKQIKLERFEKVIQAAMKQSLQTWLPKINPLTTFSEFVTNQQSEQLFIAHCEETERNALKDCVLPNKSTTILIGPEGDFSSQEINAALCKKYKPVMLGNNRLRTETAAIFACTTVRLINS